MIRAVEAMGFKSNASVAAELNARKVPTARGKEWTSVCPSPVIRTSGKGLDRNFCPKCDARVFTSNLECFPGTIFVTRGTLYHPEGIEPVLEMFTKRRAKPLDLPQFENMPS